jgi:haloalkane dehalogenase
MNAELRKLYQLPYDSKANRLATLKFVQDIPLDAKDASFDLISQTEKNLKNLKDKPILLAWGMKDFVFDKHFLNKWIDLFPHAKVLRYEDAGHYVLEDIGEPLCQEIFDFLKRQ